MKKRYLPRQLFLLANQLGIIIYLCMMHYLGIEITASNGLHLCIVSLLFFDAAYVSYKNIQSNSTLTHFSFLLLLAAWQFLFSIFEESSISLWVSTILLPFILYQTTYFLQSFLFQDSAYQYQRGTLLILKITCAISTAGYIVSERFFSIAFMMQSLITLFLILFINAVHRKRVAFFLKSQRRNLVLSICFVVLPFLCYVAVFHSKSEYLENLGTYLIIMMSFVSIHSIIFHRNQTNELLPDLNRKDRTIFMVVGICLFASIASLLAVPWMTIFLLVHASVLLLEFRNLLLYWQASNAPEDFFNRTDQRHFYLYSLAQIKREETLKKDFSNYLHDDILQDLLSIKNLIRKAGRPEIQKLIAGTLDGLNTSIRSQMQVYHPTLLKSLTLKENLQNQLDALMENHLNNDCTFQLDCNDNVFLVEPYNVILYRMITELAKNVLKHSKATKAVILLTQEDGQIFLKVQDNGIGFQAFPTKIENHRGLHSIQEQVSLLEGSMTIHSLPESGTQIIITMPMKGDDSYESFISR